jgi:general secretion pathway protein E
LSKLKSKKEVEARVVDYLQGQGYEVTPRANLQGKSGIDHIFDIIAHLDDGIVKRTIAIHIFISDSEQASEAASIFNFANRAYDVGIKDRVMIAIPQVSPDSKELADKQRIKVIDEKQIDTFLTELPEPVRTTQKTGKSFQFETKEKLIQSLQHLGYQVEEKAKIIGRSGVEYTFDILATGNSNRIGRKLGIDIKSGGQEVGLDAVSLYDTKAFDTALDEKIIAIMHAPLSVEAKQFAEHQDIKVLQLGKKAELELEMVEEEISAPQIQREKKRVEPLTEKNRQLVRQISDPDVMKLIPEVLARRYNAIPLSKSGNMLQVAMADPTDILALEAFSVQSRLRIKPVTATIKEVREAIDFHYKGYSEIEKQVAEVSTARAGVDDEKIAFDAALDAPLVQAVQLIIDEAVKARASDVHIEPEEERVRVRYRIDGTLQDMMSLPVSIHLALISRIKILSDLNIADHHKAQDGQFSTESKGREIDIRVATAPTVHGEMSVLRLLDKSTATLGLTELGLLPEGKDKFEKMLKIPYGMILVSGPTGAGKTTTLYAAVNTLDTMGRNIITIEDPAEYRFEDINQIQVNPQAGITFAGGLRFILRLDPDVILVGEVRDAETATIATQAALTGHLMLTSIHANDTTGVLFRLLDLGVEPFLIASSVIGVVAQRMVRRICPDCTQLVEAPVVEQLAYEREMGEKRTQFLYAAGCKTCAYTGYLGRTGIFEIMILSDKIRRMIANGDSSVDIRLRAIEEGMVTLMNDGMHKVRAGITTPSEVLRSAYSAEQPF